MTRVGLESQRRSGFRSEGERLSVKVEWEVIDNQHVSVNEHLYVGLTARQGGRVFISINDTDSFCEEEDRT